ncbi:MAG: hypothetical protein AB7N76_28290 [Planctomycetota bacterium]
MSDAPEPLTADVASDDDSPAAARRPRVVVIVRSVAAADAKAGAPAAGALAAATAAKPKLAPPAAKPKTEPPDAKPKTEPPDAAKPKTESAQTEGEEDGTRRFEGEQVLARVDSLPPEDVPTERFVLERKRERTAEDDELAAAVIQLDLKGDPSPLTSFLGPCLLERAARAAELAGAPRLILVAARGDAEQHDLALQAAQRGFRGPVELFGHDPELEDFGRGRLLLLDGSALHDGEALASLGRVRGESTALLLAPHGDGLKVRTEGGKVVEVGPDVQPNDGALAGACSVPAEDFVRVSARGLRAVLDELSRANQLIGRVAIDSFARQFRDAGRCDQAQRWCYDALAGSKSDGMVEQWIGRPLARALTLGLLPRLGVSPTHVLAAAGAFGIAAAALLGLAHPFLAPLAGLLLVVSAVLDRCDGELARLRLDDRPRPLDFLLDHVILGLVFLGLAWGIHKAPEGVANWDQTMRLLPQAASDAIAAPGGVTALFVGLAGAIGVALMLAVSAWRGPPDPYARGVERFGDMIASSFGSRDYAYVILLAGIIHAAMPGLGVLGLVLLVCSAAVHGFWVLLLLTQLISPRRARGA